MKHLSARWVCLLLAGIVSGCQSSPETRIERFVCAVEMFLDGSLEVRETLTVQASQGPAWFERSIGPGQFDTISLVSASVDGHEVAAADPAPGRDLRLRVPLPATAGSTHEVGLVYRATAALFLQGRRGYLRWPVLPVPRDHVVASAHVTLVAPPGRLTPAGIGMAEHGWTVATARRGIEAHRDNVPAADETTLVAEMVIDPAEISEPRWQYDVERSAELVPAFISGGLFILVIGAGVIWIMRWQYADRGALNASTSPADPVVEEYRRAARGLWISGLLCIGLALATGFATKVTLSRFGAWPFTIAGSIAMVGVLFFFVGRRWEKKA